ncbi:MAG: metallophosphatase family protein [Bacilli bacterium]|nr:metallophosphatase family protein [Bacilli bacterium]
MNVKRQIAIFTDAHALLEPVEAILEDIKKRGISEIYSLGDNISVGPNPSEVLSFLEENNVISVAGNAEAYIRLGLEPFACYFTWDKVKSEKWTRAHLTPHQIDLIYRYPYSIDLEFGGKKIALCHFANDVRYDYPENGVFPYLERLKKGAAYSQFYYTNSQEQKREIEQVLQKGILSSAYFGYISTFLSPLFAGKCVDYYDAIIQGHTHFKAYEYAENQAFYAIRAVGIGYGDAPDNMASYVILTETESGYFLEDVLVPFDREKMLYAVDHSDTPDPVLRRFINYNKNR